GRAQGLVGGQGGLFARRRLSPGRAGEGVYQDRLEAGRRLPLGARREQLDPGAQLAEGPDDLLDVDGTALVAEHGDTPGGADVGEAHPPPSGGTAGVARPSPPRRRAARNRARRRSLVRRLSNSASMSCRPPAARRTRRPGSASKCSTAPASAGGSCWGTSSPVSPWRTTSGMPVTSVVTTGVPRASASWITFGRPSRSPSGAATQGTAS